MSSKPESSTAAAKREEHEHEHQYEHYEPDLPDYPPPEYFALDERYLAQDEKIDLTEFKTDGQGVSSSARITKDGRIVVSMDVKKALPNIPSYYALDVQEYAVDDTTWKDVPRMNILIMIVGSRGDVQPYLALAKALQKDGHRVRIATHGTFHEFVTSNGVEFFDIGGDPTDLMSYMVKNPGLMPAMASITNGDVGRKKKMIKEMLYGCWNACSANDADGSRPFAVDAIISNPPAFAHVHCAESLGVPLTMTFTMPWTATTAFPHPLVNVKQSNGEKGLTNFMTYPMSDLLIWQGIGNIINKFRQKKLGLPAISVTSGAGLVDRLKIPWTYSMSPGLIPKPADWRNHIDVVGFYFLDLARDYVPTAELAAFLAGGPPPVYIGFGSVVVDDPEGLTETIFRATKAAGVRALVSAGWGGLGGKSIPEHVFILGNVPHDWLFSNGRVAAVVHHGGAGTTAIGIAKGRPTLVVPFFGDQRFWGAMVYYSGAGPKPIPIKELSVESLAHAIGYLMSPRARTLAARLGERIKGEDGVKKGVESFYRHLPLLNMRCDLEPSRLAVWWCPDNCLKLSAFAAQTLANKRLVNMNNMELHRPIEYESRREIKDPLTASAVLCFNTVSNFSTGLAQLLYRPIDGAINLTTAGPKMAVDFFGVFQEGFYNLPKMYGSRIRRAGKVTDLKSGVIEGGKNFALGFYDGVTGVVLEPIQGAKESGFTGAMKGTAKGGLFVRSSAAVVGVVSQPMEGAWKSIYRPIAAKQERERVLTRVLDGIEDVRNSTAEERERVLERFQESLVGLKARKKKIRADQIRWLERDGDNRSTAKLSKPSAGASESGSRRGSESESGVRSERVSDRSF